MQQQTCLDNTPLQQPDHQAMAPYGFYILIWVVLLILTQFTVMAGQFHLGLLGKVIAVIVTPAKASLVLLYFMHLRHEKPVFLLMLFFALLTLVVSLGLTFMDYSYRP